MDLSMKWLADYVDCNCDIKRYSKQYVLESVYESSDPHAESIKKGSKMFCEPINGSLYILSDIYHNSIAF